MRVVSSLEHIKFLSQALKKKHVSLWDYTSRTVNNRQVAFMKLFIRRKKSNVIAKKKKLCSGFNTLKRKSFLTLNKFFGNHNFTSLKFWIVRTNLLKEKKLVRLEMFNFYKGSLKFKHNLFSRRTETFLDYIYLTNLLVLGKIKTQMFLSVVCEIIAGILKQKHGLFLFFIKNAVKYAIDFLRSKVLGIAFWISGKLKGKPRAKTAKINFGVLPKQTILSNIDYSKMHTYNRYGAFGLKLWINATK